MATFIGTNDRETLLGVADELRRAGEGYLKTAERSKKRVDRKRFEDLGLVLIEEAVFFETCAKNGPTPNMVAVLALRKANGLDKDEKGIP